MVEPLYTNHPSWNVEISKSPSSSRPPCWWLCGYLCRRHPPRPRAEPSPVPPERCSMGIIDKVHWFTCCLTIVRLDWNQRNSLRSFYCMAIQQLGTMMMIQLCLCIANGHDSKSGFSASDFHRVCSDIPNIDWVHTEKKKKKKKTAAAAAAAAAVVGRSASR